MDNDRKIVMNESALDEIPEEHRGAIMAMIAEHFILPGALERTLAKSRAVWLLPENKMCPKCHYRLFEAPDFQDWECFNDGCELFKKVVFLDYDNFSKISQRFEGE